MSRENSDSGRGADAPRETVLVLGAWRQSLAVVRSLGRAGYRVLIARARGSAYLERSRYLDRAVDLPLDPDAPFAARLAELLPAAEGRAFLFPVGDREIDFVLARIAEIPSHVVPVMAPASAISVCRSKARLTELAEGVGVPCARPVLVERRADLHAAAERIGYPCLVKPDNERRRLAGRKAVIFTSPEELQAFVEEPDREPAPLLLLRYFLGRRRNVYFLAEEGALLADAHVEIIRTDRIDDTGLAVEGITVHPDPRLRAHTRRLIEALRYHGVGCAQFLVDAEDRHLLFLEVNARLGANFAAVLSVGFDLPRLAVELAAGKDVRMGLTREFPAGRRNAWFLGDLRGLSRAVRKREVGPRGALLWFARLVRAQLRAGSHITWDRRDPLPTFRSWLQYAGPRRKRPSL